MKTPLTKAGDWLFAIAMGGNVSFLYHSRLTMRVCAITRSLEPRE